MGKYYKQIKRLRPDPATLIDEARRVTKGLTLSVTLIQRKMGIGYNAAKELYLMLLEERIDAN